MHKIVNQVLTDKYCYTPYHGQIKQSVVAADQRQVGTPEYLTSYSLLISDAI